MHFDISSDRSRSDRRYHSSTESVSDETMDDLSSEVFGMDIEEESDSWMPTSNRRARPKQRVALLASDPDNGLEPFLESEAEGVEKDFQLLAIRVMKRSLQGIAYFGTSFICCVFGSVFWHSNTLASGEIRGSYYHGTGRHYYRMGSYLEIDMQQTQSLNQGISPVVHPLCSGVSNF